jgi:hypothetical protein
MSQKDVAFALELVARVMEGRVTSEPGSDETVTNYTLNDVAYELRTMGEKLRDAPVSVDSMCAWVEGSYRGERGHCLYHPLGGFDCVYARG